MNVLTIFLGGPMGPIHPVWALAAIHPGWGNRYTLGELRQQQQPQHGTAQQQLSKASAQHSTALTALANMSRSFAPTVL